LLDACLAFIAPIVEPTLSRGDDATCSCSGDQLQGVGRLRGRLSCRAPTSSLICVTVQAQHPSLLQNFQEFEAQAAGKRVAVFLDYDGALLEHGTIPAIRAVVVHDSCTRPISAAHSCGRHEQGAHTQTTMVTSPVCIDHCRDADAHSQEPGQGLHVRPGVPHCQKCLVVARTSKGRS